MFLQITNKELPRKKSQLTELCFDQQATHDNIFKNDRQAVKHNNSVLCPALQVLTHNNSLLRHAKAITHNNSILCYNLQIITTSMTSKLYLIKIFSKAQINYINDKIKLDTNYTSKSTSSHCQIGRLELIMKICI